MIEGDIMKPYCMLAYVVSVEMERKKKQKGTGK